MTSLGLKRRRHERHGVFSGAFALLRSDDKEILGAIRNISAGGLSLSHIEDKDKMVETAGINIDLISDQACHEEFKGRKIWERREECGFATSTVKMNCCGLAFEELSGTMQAQLTSFIESLQKL